jgi:hypothetical protein
MKLSLNDQIFCSLIDPVGQVFYKDGKIIRLINDDFVAETLLLLKSGLIEELVSEGIFPKTTISDIAVKGFSLVLEHELIPVSYPYQWSPSMIKDAALLTIRVNKIASQYGYFLKDFHGFNVLFKGQTPIFVDFGSLIKQDVERQENINEFIESFVIPLILFQEGDYYLAHKLLVDVYSPGCRLLVGSISKYLQSKVRNYYVFEIEIFKLIKLKLSNNLLMLLIRKITNKTKFIKIVTSVNFLESKITQIRFSQKPNTTWENYQNQYELSEIPYRFEKIIQLTSNLPNVKTSLDIAGNHGYLSSLLSNLSKFEKLTSMDYDLLAIEMAYSLNTRKPPHINLIANSFFELTHDTALVDRIKSDVVYGLALTHHLILSQDLRINTILDVFYNVSNSYVFIEFMPLGLWSEDHNSTPNIPSWYTIEWFRDNFLCFFNLIEEIKTEKNRILFLGEKKI